MGRSNRYSKQVRLALAYARKEAQRLRHRLVGPEHLLLGMIRMKEPLVEGLFLSLHAPVASIAQALDFVIGRGKRAFVSEPVLNAALRAVLARAEQEALAAHSAFIGIEHLLLGLLAERNGIVMGVLESFGIEPEHTRHVLLSLLQRGYDHLVSSLKYQESYHATPLLNQVSRDLMLDALNGTLDPLIGREAELERISQILLRRTKNSPVLLGPAGAGKTAIVEGLAQRVIHGLVPEPLLNCRIVALDSSLLISGIRFRGDFEERLQAIIQEVVGTPNLIIVLDELSTLIQVGVAEGSLEAANLLKPLLARGDLRCIGVTTPEEYRKMIEPDPALARRFQPVLIAEPGVDETLRILQGVRACYERHHHVRISDEALQAAVQMSARYIQGRCQPDKALDLLDEAAAGATVRLSEAPAPVLELRSMLRNVLCEKDDAVARRDFSLATSLFRRARQLRQDLWRAEADWRIRSCQRRPCIGPQDIVTAVALRTGIPAACVSSDERELLLNLEQKLEQQVVGQPQAVQAVARAIRRARSRIRSEHERRPLGSFLFAGPAGVGKSELARALAATLFDDEHALLTLDMSEFAEQHYISRLIGSPPGYVGYDQAGQLTEAVRRRPYSIVLFEQIEKAHPSVLNLLLQILEDGCLTDSHGHAVSFTHTVIIMTSNIGATSDVFTTQIAMTFTKKQDEHKILSYKQEHIMASIQAAFLPELLNRIDEIVVFQPLSLEHLRAIVDQMIAATAQRLTSRSITLRVTEAACLLLARYGHEARDGARPLRRAVQYLLDDPLADAIIEGTISDGDIVLVDASNGKLSFCVHKRQDEEVA